MNKLTHITVTAFVLFTSLGAQAASIGSWQKQMLYAPSQSQLKMEQRGRVMIYDGLKDTEVDNAMDKQFERIDSMMFVRTVVTDKQGEPLRNEATGEVVAENDGC
ncbi:MAG: hypothetical protein H6953_16300 [Chromatiaceae bacterium]|nr:hypothetical protein [Gammaproteobacteria bacterium]MCP5298092.1 hypothetical protein [Chromatiaceae bacterium]MCP5307006.1 hypothetical protein [Chromatiaceae bacterium]MCP5423368.1 hypothetical protein [Chromatiaceae bacterium]